MEELKNEQTIAKHRAPVWFQLTIALIVVGLFGALFAMPAEAENLTITPLLAHILQVVLVLMIFVLPAVLLGLVLRSDKLNYLNLFKKPKFIAVIIASLICIASLPLVSWTGTLNANMHLPGFLSDLETWMRVREKMATESMGIFFQDKTTTGLIMNLIVIAFFAGLSEEIFFRGMIQKLFIENKMNYHFAIWITAILFSAIHIQFLGFIPRMLLGAVLGYLYHYSGNLWVPIIAHTVNNAVGVFMIRATSKIAEDPLTGNQEQEVGAPLALISFAFVIGMIFLLFKFREKNTEITPIKLP